MEREGISVMGIWGGGSLSTVCASVAVGWGVNIHVVLSET
jgi:hypothetical protein